MTVRSAARKDPRIGASRMPATPTQVTPTAPPTPSNAPPHADFDVHCDHLVCTFQDKSQDDDGTIVSRQWDFGDGSGSAEQNPTHTYSEQGRYNVHLTVTDDDGASATKDRRADAKR